MRNEILGFEHKDLLRKRLKEMDTIISEYSFANLYLFRNVHDYKIVYISDNIFIKGVTYDGKNYFMPTEVLSDAVVSYMKELLINNEIDFVFPVDEKWLKYFDDSFDFDHKDSDTDYVYTVDKMSTYKGRNLHKKRNLLKQFQETYTSEILPIAPSRKRDAFIVLEKWLIDSEMDKDDTDYVPCFESLELMDVLMLCGLLYYVEGEPVAFLLGEEVWNDTFVIHFAKGLKNYKGVYQFVYNSFAKMLPKKYSYINFEQDMGKPALRLAKSSYEPDILCKKYRVFLKK